MLAHNTSQLKHRHLRLAEHGQQLGVGVDGALVGGVLQALGLDVVPQLFDDLRPDHQLTANDGGQRVAGLEARARFGNAGNLGLDGFGCRYFLRRDFFGRCLFGGRRSFGPIIGIQKVSGDKEAVNLMNDTRYGLTAGVFTPDEARAKAVLAQVNAGSVYWNCCDRVSPRLPWSGYGDSGVGLTLSTYGIQTFTRPKAWHLRQP